MEQLKTMKRSWRGLILILALLLTACGTAPVASSPRPPELTVRVPPGPSFQERMQNFLRGKLPEQTPSERDSPPVTK